MIASNGWCGCFWGGHTDSATGITQATTPEVQRLWRCVADDRNDQYRRAHHLPRPARSRDQISGQWMMTMTEHHKITETIIFKTRIKVCRWKVRAEVGPFCRKGLRGPAATCEQMSFQFKIMSREITTPLFVSPHHIPLSLRLASKVLSGRRDLQKSPQRSLLRLHFPYGTGRSSTTGLLEQMP